MHSRLLASLGVAALVATLPCPLPAQEKMTMKAPPSRDATVTGTVVAVSGRFAQGLSGPATRMCAGVGAARGIRLAFLADDGTLYLPTSAAMPGDGQNPRLKPFAEQRVTISGKVFDAGGAKAIQIASIRKA